MYDDKILSKTITALRFPMIFLVVLLHTIIIDQNCFGKTLIPHGKYPVFEILLHVLQRNIGDIAVPLFFFISGYLFFLNIKDFNITIYKNKLKKRKKSLLIPYFLWNTLFFLFLLTCYIISPSLVQSFDKYFSELTVTSFIQSYWSLNGGPILSPMWFIRDLIILTLLSPFIYWIIKRTNLIIVIIVAVIFFIGIYYETPGIGGRIWFPYMFGAFWSIQGKNFLNAFAKYRLLIFSSFILFVFVDTWLSSNGHRFTIINHLSIAFGMASIPLVCAYFINKGVIQENTYIAKASFFVFGFHMFIINIPNKFFPYLIPINTFTAILLQILIPLIVCIFSLIIYSVLNRLFPKLSNILVGGR